MKNIVTNQPSGQPEELATLLLNHLNTFQAFARRRLDDEQLAADAVQGSLLKASKAEPDLEERVNLLEWFYRILRNVLTDLHRRKAASERAMVASIAIALPNTKTIFQ